MPEQRDPQERDRSLDRTLGAYLAFIAFYTATIAFASGATWRDFLHWTGELLLIVGVLLAAKGISDVRREWTGRPGIVGRAGQIVHGVRAAVAERLWLSWNRALERWPQLAGPLHLRAHQTLKNDHDTAAFAEAAMAAAKAHAVGVVITGELSTEDRFRRLEQRAAEAEKRMDALNMLYMQEVQARQTATDQERAKRLEAEQQIRQSMANFAGGGLRLQAWGVVCLLAGTIVTAFW